MSTFGSVHFLTLTEGRQDGPDSPYVWQINGINVPPEALHALRPTVRAHIACTTERTNQLRDLRDARADLDEARAEIERLRGLLGRLGALVHCTESLGPLDTACGECLSCEIPAEAIVP